MSNRLQENVIRHYRKKADLTQIELAERLSVSEHTVGAWERNQRRPSKQTCEHIADVLEAVIEDKETFVAEAREILFEGKLPSQPNVSPLLKNDFVGREPETSLLQNLFKDEESNCLTWGIVWGMAGVGKTRFCEEFCKLATEQGIVNAMATCFPEEAGTSYEPLYDWLFSDALNARLSRVESSTRADVVRLLPNLILDHPSLSLRSGLPTSAERTRSYNAIGKVLLLDQNALILFLDDLQWVSPDTMEWLKYFVERFVPRERSLVNRQKILLLTTIRSENFLDMDSASRAKYDAMRETLQKKNWLLDINLEPLNQSQAVKLFNSSAQVEKDTKVARQVHQMSGGLPLSILNLANLAQSVSVENLSAFLSQHTPDSTTSLIDSAISRCSKNATELAKILAVIGITCSSRMLSRVIHDKDIENYESAIEELMRRQILKFDSDKGEYEFSHALYREAFYREIVPERRKELHLYVYTLLEGIYENDSSVPFPRLAYHLEMCEMYSRAIEYYQLASEEAYNSLAFEDQIRLLEAALKLVGNLPIPTERIIREFEIRTQLIAPLITLYGYGAPTVAENCHQAHRLSKLLPTDKVPFLPISGLGTFHMIRGEFKEALKLQQKLFVLATKRNRALYVAEAEFMRGVIELHVGNLREANENLKPNEFESAVGSDAALVYSVQHPVINKMGYLGLAQWLGGLPDSAVITSERALAKALQQTSPYVIAMAYMTRAWVACLCRNWRDAEMYAHKIVTTSEQYDIAFWYAIGKMFVGVAHMKLNRFDEGIEWLHEGRSLYENIGAYLALPFFICHEAEAFLERNNLAQTKKILTNSEELKIVYNEAFYLSELYRLTGLLDLQENTVRAESNFLRAIQTAQTQGAKALELRATLELSKLLDTKGHRDEAYQRLTGIYSQFSEGFDTQDLRNANQFLKSITHIP